MKAYIDPKRCKCASEACAKAEGYQRHPSSLGCTKNAALDGLCPECMRFQRGSIAGLAAAILDGAEPPQA